MVQFNVLLALGGVFGALFVGYVFVKTRYKKSGPDEALVVFGRKQLMGDKVTDEEGRAEGFRIVHGGGTFIWPGWESFERLSLKMMTLEINMPHVYTEQGIPINVKAVAQVKIRATTEFIKKAAEAFLGLEVSGVKDTIQETVAGHLRGIIGTLTVESLYRDQRSFQEKVRDEAHGDLGGHGLRVQVLRVPGDPGRAGLPRRARPAQDPAGPESRPGSPRPRLTATRRSKRRAHDAAKEEQKRLNVDHRDRRGREAARPQARFHPAGRGRRERRKQTRRARWS